MNAPDRAMNDLSQFFGGKKTEEDTTTDPKDRQRTYGHQHYHTVQARGVLDNIRKGYHTLEVFASE